MTLKGDYSSGTTYSVGDVVRYTDGRVYHLQKAAAAGTTPINTLYWGKVDQNLAEAVKMVLDMEADDVQLEDDLTQATAGKKALDAHQGKVLKEAIDTVDDKVDALVIPTNINDEAIVLKDSSDNEYLITIDASGDTPELSVTLIEAEEPAAEGGEGGEGGES